MDFIRILIKDINGKAIDQRPVKAGQIPGLVAFVARDEQRTNPTATRVEIVRIQSGHEKLVRAWEKQSVSSFYGPTTTWVHC